MQGEPQSVRRCLDHEANAALASTSCGGTSGERLPSIHAWRASQESGIEFPRSRTSRLDRKPRARSSGTRTGSRRATPRQDRQDEGRHVPSGLKPEHAAIWTPALVAAELHPADQGAGRRPGEDAGGGQGQGRGMDAAPTAEPPPMCDRQPASLTVGLIDLDDVPWKTRGSPSPIERFCALARRRGVARRAVTNNRTIRLKSGVRPVGRLQAAASDRRALLCAQPDRGGMRRTSAARARERAASDTWTPGRRATI